MKAGDRKMSSRIRREKLAAEMQANKDDLTEWELVASEPPREPSLSISLRLPPGEIDLLQERAAAMGTTVSALVRAAIHRYFDNATAPTLRFSFVERTVFSPGPPEPFTEARRYKSQIPEPQV